MSRGINAILFVVVLAAAAGVARLYFGERPAVADTMGDPDPVAVIAQSVRLQPLKNQIQALGTARASESVTITPEVAGIIEDIRFQQSSVVEAGQILVTLQAADAKAGLEAAHAAVAQRQSTYQRKRELHQSGLVPDAELEQAQTQLRTARSEVAVAEAALANHVIRAPFTGRLGLREVSAGGWVQPGIVITTLDDVTPVQVEFSVPGRFVGTLAPGQTIVAHAAAYPQAEFSGTVQAVATRVDPVTRAVQVRAVLNNAQRLLKPGMLLTMHLIRGTAPALMIPELAVVAQNDKQFVFVVENGKAQRRAVQTGQRRPGRVEITAGLQPGDVVVTQGTLKLHDGTPVEREQQTDTAAAESIG